jgi:hypothetical protein
MQQPLPWTISPWPHNLSQQASGNPGAVHTASTDLAHNEVDDRATMSQKSSLAQVIRFVSGALPRDTATYFWR